MNMDIEDILGDIKASNGKADKPAKVEKTVKAEKPAKAVAKPAVKKAAPAKAVKAPAKAVAKPMAKKAAPKAPAKAVKAPAKAVAKPVAKKAAPVKAAAKPVAKKATATTTKRPSEFIVFAEGERQELAKQIKKMVRKEMNSRVIAERLGIHSRKLRRVLYGMHKAGQVVVVPGPSRKLGMYVQPV